MLASTTLAPHSRIPGVVRGQWETQQELSADDADDADLLDYLVGLLNHICAHLRHLRIISSPA